MYLVYSFKNWNILANKNSSRIYCCVLLRFYCDKCYQRCQRLVPAGNDGNHEEPPTTYPNSLEPAGGHCHLYENHPLVPFLSQTNPFAIVMSYFSKIHSSRIHLGLPRYVFASGFRAGFLYLFFSLQFMLCVHPSHHP